MRSQSRQSARRRAKMTTGVWPTSVLVARSTTGGVADVASHSAAYLRTRDVVVHEVAMPKTGNAAVTALRHAWSSRRAICDAEIVHIELGALEVVTFWFAVWAGLLRRDLLLVLHDIPVMVKNPGSGLIRTGLGARDIVAYRFISPLLDAPLTTWVVRHASVFVALSEDAARSAEQRGWRPCRVTRHGGVPPVGSCPPSQGGHVLMIGHLAPAKGVDILLRAWSTAGDLVGLPLILAGPSHDDAWLREQRSVGYRLSSPPLWLDWVDDELFEQLLSTAAIVVLPYRTSNPASGVLVKAKLHGRAIIATRVPAALGEIVDGEDGILVDVGDEAQVAATLIELAGDPARRDALGATAASRARHDHSWDRHLAGLYGLPADRSVDGVDRTSASTDGLVQ